MIKIKANRVDRNKCTLKSAKKCVDNICKGLFFGVVEDLGKLSVIIQIFSPLFVFFMIKQNVYIVLCFSVFITFVTRFMTKFYYHISNNTINSFDIPVPTKRYTKRDTYGFVTMVNQEDMVEMISYIYSLELYFEREGMYKNNSEYVKK